MTIRADSNNSFLQRFLLVAIVCFAFGLWSLYDGFIAYPKKLERSEAYHELAEEFEDSTSPAGLNDENEQKFFEEWEQLATEKGWSVAKPKKTPPEIESDILWQYGMAIVAFLVGIPVLIKYFGSRNSWVESDGKSLTTSWGQRLDFDEITEVNKKKWFNKGIARVHYRDDGRNRTFVMDDFKYDRDQMDKIMREIEAVVDRSAIVGGPTQAEYQETLAAEEEPAEELEESGSAEERQT